MYDLGFENIYLRVIFRQFIEPRKTELFAVLINLNNHCVVKSSAVPIYYSLHLLPTTTFTAEWRSSYKVPHAILHLLLVFELLLLLAEDPLDPEQKERRAVDGQGRVLPLLTTPTHLQHCRSFISQQVEDPCRYMLPT